MQPAYGLYPYQRQVLNDLLGFLVPANNALVINGGRVIAHMPTGAGKTRVACHAACRLLNRSESEGKLVVWLASTEELCEQAAESLAQAWRSLGNRPIDVHRFWGDASLRLDDLNEGFLIAGLPKLWAASRNDSKVMLNLANMAAGVIFDEAHQAIANTYSYITEYLLTYQPPLLGLTATPGRTSEPGDSDFDLAEMFNFNKVSIDPKGHGSPVTYLVKQEFLADPRFEHIEIESQLSIREHGEGLDYTRSDLDTIGNNEEWQEAIIERSLRATRRHNRVIVFCPSVMSAKECSAIVRNAGIDAEAILGETPSEIRQDIIGRFRQNTAKPMAIFNYGVLTAGFDAPRTRCVIIARPTKSLVLYSQMVGRAMRGPRSGGNRFCSIQTVVDISLPGFGSVVEAFRNWEQLWQEE